MIIPFDDCHKFLAVYLKYHISNLNIKVINLQNMEKTNNQDQKYQKYLQNSTESQFSNPQKDISFDQTILQLQSSQQQENKKLQESQRSVIGDATTIIQNSIEVSYPYSQSSSTYNSTNSFMKKISSFEQQQTEKEQISNAHNFLSINYSSSNQNQSEYSFRAQIANQIKQLNSQSFYAQNKFQDIKSKKIRQEKIIKIIDKMLQIKLVNLESQKFQKLYINSQQLIHIFKSLHKRVKIILIFDILFSSFSCLQKKQQTHLKQDYFIYFQPNEFKFIPNCELDQVQLAETLLCLLLPECRKKQQLFQKNNIKKQYLKQYHKNRIELEKKQQLNQYQIQKDIVEKDLDAIKNIKRDDFLQMISMKYVLDEHLSTRTNIEFVKLVILCCIGNKQVRPFKNMFERIIQDFNLQIQFDSNQKRFKYKQQQSILNSRHYENQPNQNIEQFFDEDSISTIPAAVRHFEQLDNIKSVFSQKYHPFLCVMSYPDISKQQLKKQFQGQIQHFPCFNLKQSMLPDLNIKNVLQEVPPSMWKKITSLDCGNCPIQNLGLKQILKYDWSHLKSLDIWYTGITTLANTKLYEIKNLIYFSASYNKFQMDTLDYLIEHKQSWKQVKDFRISFQNGDIVWPKFVQHQKQTFPSLKYLGVRNQHLLSQQTLNLIKSLKSNGLQMNI